jgi:general secretion pathway protein I
MKPRVRCPASGFTLLEVVVALAILGLGLVAVIQIFSGGLRLARATEEYSQAVHLAQAKLEEWRMAESLSEGEEEGEFNPRYRWWVGIRKVEVLPMEKKEIQAPVELYQIQLKVRWETGGTEKAATFESFRLMKYREDGSKR